MSRERRQTPYPHQSPVLINERSRLGYFTRVQVMDCVCVGPPAATLRRAHNGTLVRLPSISSSLLSLPRVQCRQVGLTGCIGQRQSRTPSCGNRSLMISILRLSRLRYIYLGCRDSQRRRALHLFSHNFIRS